MVIRGLFTAIRVYKIDMNAYLQTAEQIKISANREKMQIYLRFSTPTISSAKLLGSFILLFISLYCCLL